jgi:putative NADH-flavin reductase
MDNKLKIAVIGGTGKSGKYLVSELIKEGFHFKILIRNPENFQIKNSLAEIVEGDARNYEAISKLIAGCRAIISTLGQPRGESSIFSAATNNILMAMNEHHCKRYIVTTGLSVDTPLDKKNEQTKFATEWMKKNYPETTADKQTEYNTLVESNINWTLIRLPLIELSDIKRKVNISLEDCPGDTISAATLAHFLIQQLADESYSKKAPFIANG